MTTLELKLKLKQLVQTQCQITRDINDTRSQIRLQATQESTLCLNEYYNNKKCAVIAKEHNISVVDVRRYISNHKLSQLNDEVAVLLKLNEELLTSRNHPNLGLTTRQQPSNMYRYWYNEFYRSRKSIVRLRQTIARFKQAIIGYV